VGNGLISAFGLSARAPPLYSRQIVGWQLGDNMQESLVREPLVRALLKRRAKRGMIIHSDRGGQYLSRKMKKVVKTFKLTQSMSRADDPYDNAWAESFWSRLKAELDMPKGGYESIDKLKTILFEYIEGYYNSRRLHSSLNYLNPVAFEAEYYRQTG
jgi:transposase InsO family protein